MISLCFLEVFLSICSTRPRSASLRSDPRGDPNLSNFSFIFHDCWCPGASILEVFGILGAPFLMVWGVWATDPVLVAFFTPFLALFSHFGLHFGSHFGDFFDDFFMFFSIQFLTSIFHGFGIDFGLHFGGFLVSVGGHFPYMRKP